MIQYIVERQQDVLGLATTLFQQGERCAAAGLPEQAEAILAQVWAMTEGAAPDLANDTASNVKLKRAINCQ